MNKMIEELMQKEYWIIDILPKQVPKNSAGQYFSIEEYYLSPERFSTIKQKHIDLVLKLNCYHDLIINGEDIKNPPPEHIADAMRTRDVNIVIGNVVISSEADDTHMTLYNPDKELLKLTKAICSGEGLYLWKPER